MAAGEESLGVLVGVLVVGVLVGVHVCHSASVPTAWHAFEKRYFGYWMELGGQSAIRSYSEVARDRRGARHGVAWLTEAYLARHGLDYAGQPMA